MCEFFKLITIEAVDGYLLPDIAPYLNYISELSPPFDKKDIFDEICNPKRYDDSENSLRNSELAHLKTDISNGSESVVLTLENHYTNKRYTFHFKDLDGKILAPIDAYQYWWMHELIEVDEYIEFRVLFTNNEKIFLRSKHIKFEQINE